MLGGEFDQKEGHQRSFEDSKTEVYMIGTNDGLSPR